MSELQSKSFLRRRRKLLAFLGFAFVSAAAFVVSGIIWFLFFSDFPGGMRPSYPAADGDQRLTRVAKSALPLIAMLQTYHDQHCSYPADLKQSAALGWRYSTTPKFDSYILYRRLGWDPSLEYDFDGTAGRWLFDPGDGAPQRTLVLNP